MKRCTLREQELCVNDVIFEKLMIVYTIALTKVNNIIEELSEKMKNENSYNIVTEISSRIKKPDSIIEKMIKKGYDLTYQSLVENINDIAGIRLVCMSEQDVYRIVEKIEKIKEIKILNRKDYIKIPKESGYSAYHIIVEVPIYLDNKKNWIKVEIQVRTYEMDSWANLEHEVNYKGIAKAVDY